MKHKLKKKLYRLQFKKLAHDFIGQQISVDKRVVLFTAATAREGTSTIAREFSEALVAQSGRRVSLVDSSRLDGVNRIELEKSLIERLKKDYDYIVIDAPPVMDAPEVGRWLSATDGMYFVIAAEKTRRPVVRKALELVRRYSVPILGVVLNKRRYPIPERIYQFLYH